MSDDSPSDGPDAEDGEDEAKAEEPKKEDSEPGLALKDAIESPDDFGPAEAYLRRARLAEDRLQEVLAAYRKLKSDNEGHRERATRNIERRFDQRRERLLLKFIDILDNLDRALEAAETSYAAEPLIEGLILVRTQLLQTLQEEGLERIPVIGLPYDPNLSEAVQTVPVSDPEHDHVVVKELMRGYRLNGKIARASRVAIGQYDGAETGEATPEKKAASPAPPAPSETEPAAAGEPSLEEIISRAQAQEALFPSAFDASEDKKPDEE
ncbi:MAG TPA: nucleotide exchange factor GrpE [Vicinamibacteria bacterium]|nr:nucleotide exchange factor GrpE [Vicinamibacteria bacterium]